MRDAPPQLPLPFTARVQYGAAGFVDAPSNAVARAWLAQNANWPSGRLVLTAPPGFGKTHLAHVWAGRRGSILDGATLYRLPAIEAQRRIALDNADRAPDDQILLHLINASAEAGCPLLLTARAFTPLWPATLPDLTSRLRATQQATIAAPEDDLLRAILARLLRDRQLIVGETVQSWLLHHVPRTAASLREAVDRLDRAALAQHRIISLHLARACLGPLLANPPDTDEAPMTSDRGSRQTQLAL